ncbi:hypothetical protein LCL97_03875 [Seohaeicola saemankumensis]|nr:hypothetical protein [Seohaeicola saemankumensis]MCA0869952.1 hypothetical protein [Seohaeicola saemankumensis]
MQVIVHTGAHATDEDRLLRCLLRNKETLSAQGVAVPGPSNYRFLLKSTFQAMEEATPAPDARDVLIDAILDDEVADRVILSNEHFFGSQRFALGETGLYPDGPQRITHLRQLFEFDQVEMFMAIRNPATFLPAVLQKAAPKRKTEILSAIDPLALRWSDTLLRIREAAPDVPLTVWCNEDLPLIWGQLIRELAGLEPSVKMAGTFDLLSEIMSKEGMQRFRVYLHENPTLTEMQRRRVIAAFLDKFAIDDELEEELDLPGWTEDLVDEMTEIYDEDVFRIQRIPGVQMISP